MLSMKLIRKGFIGVLAAFMVSAVTPLLIPFALDGDGNLNGAGYAAGVMFWAGLIAGCAGYALLYRKEKEKIETGAEKRNRPSALYFFSNLPAKAADGIMIVGVIGTVICAVNVTVNQTVAVIFLLLMLAGIYAHFLFNGKLYSYIWNCKPTYKNEQLKEKKGMGI